MHKKIIPIIVVLVVSVGVAIGWVREVGATIQNAPVITVGNGAGCDYQSISNAINAAASGSEIHVEAATFLEDPIHINQKDLTLVGGYSASGTCLAESPNSYTTLKRSGSSTNDYIIMVVMSDNFRLQNFILSDNQNGGGLSISYSHVTLENVDIKNNTYTGLSAYVSDLSMVDVELSGNQANAGAGAHLGRSVVTMTNVVISNNHVSTGVGGGVFSYGDAGQPQIIKMSNVEIANNSASDAGGGLFLAAYVSMTLNQGYVYLNRVTGVSGYGGGLTAMGHSTVTLKENVDVNFNQVSNGYGGGIALRGNSILNANDATIGSNNAGVSGGAIYADSNSQVKINNVEIASNSADSGGGVHLDNADMECSRSFFHDNLALTGDGGAMLVADGEVEVARTRFISNHAKNEGGALKVFGSSTTAVFTSTNSLYAENADLVALQVAPIGITAAGGSSTVFEQANAYFAHNTMLRYFSTAATFGVVAKTDATVDMINNIMGNFYVAAIRSSGTNGVVNMDHTLFFGNSQNYEFSFTSSNEINGDPAFQGQYDFHLTASSDAIGQAVDLGLMVDLEGKPRILGMKPDLGAYEYGGVLYLPILNK